MYAPTVLYCICTSTIAICVLQVHEHFQELFNVFDKLDGVMDVCSSLRYCSQHKGWSGNVTPCIAGGFFVCVGAAAGPEEFNGSRLKL